ncbi:hypothetical protein DWW33_04275 [Roseburia sp. AF15-21]|uniref:hypothetical protein n=1 Tax=Roseburia sp. AF15-21 TaxID=2293128 RepID=UPI000E489789|nr:hypothetical protein [Roseburia sp. AF15-21]RHR89477.1 hypothetical protein DWW33_04275 [Roseburia sp. AF15-21]
MKKEFDEWDDLMNDIKSDVDDVLSKEVFDEVRDIEMEHIQTDVFSQYTPKIYERRSNGGIDDPRNIVGYEKRMHLSVVNEAQFNDDYGTYNHGYGLPQLINDGDSRNGFYYDFPGVYNAPRPFIDNAVEEVERSERVDFAFEDGMKKRGNTMI